MGDFPFLSTIIIFSNDYVCMNEGENKSAFLIGIITTPKWNLQCIRAHKEVDSWEKWEDVLGPTDGVIILITIGTICLVFFM